MTELVLIAHNIRSAHNVGALLRTAEGLGVSKVCLTGYTPYPKHAGDARLPHLAAKIDAQIHKTALGAEKTLAWRQADDVKPVLEELSASGFSLAALEQTPEAVKLPDYQPPAKLAILLGEEVHGITADLLARCQVALEIPMFGNKESFNVVQAAAMALYHCRFAPSKQ